MLYDSGISHIRIPVGYWIVDVQSDEPFPPPPATDDEGQRFYLKRLMKWAEQIGLKVSHIFRLPIFRPLQYVNTFKTLALSI